MNFGIFVANRNRNKADRPVIRPEMMPVDWLFEALAFIGLVTMAGFLIYHFPRLPETIPSHFDGAGVPDEFSGRSTLWVLPGISLLLYILLSVMMRVPHQFNYSVKITRENAAIQYAMAMRLIRYLKAGLMWMFFYIVYGTVMTAEQRSEGLGLWFLPVTVGGMILPVFVYLFLASRRQ